jgi:protein TonB
MKLLERLDGAIGKPGAVDKRIVQIAEENNQTPADQEPEVMKDLAAGSYDALFKDAPDKPPVLYEAARVPPPGVQLLSSTPFRPERFVVPVYPPLARLAHVQGQVAFRVEVDGSGRAKNFTIKSGNPLLRGAVEVAVGQWRFPTEAANQTVEAVVEFKGNCSA